MEGMGLGAAGARGWGDGGHGPTPPGRIVSLGHKMGRAFEGEGEGEGEAEGEAEGEVFRVMCFHVSFKSILSDFASTE